MAREVVTSERPAEEAARRIATYLSARLETAPWATLAVSGGSTAPPLLDALAGADLVWERVAVLQVDERIADAGDPDRNLTDLRAHLLDHVPAPAHPLPVDVAPPARAAHLAGRRLRALAGDPPVIDIVHLGLGTDGHTASLVPGDPVVDEDSLDVAVTGDYRGRRRLTLTAPVLSRARRVVWLVTGDDKRAALERLVADDRSIPATRVTADDQVVVTDLEVAGPDT